MENISGKKIMVVDDSLTIRMQIKDMLEDEGYEVDLAKDGETCLKLIQIVTPDIILLDIIMPGISGLDVCKAIKGDQRTQDIPILILTHVSDSKNKVAGLNAGADDYVTKPFAIEELNARISGILRTNVLQEELVLAKDAAEASAKSKSSFLANMSHEIRTPMNGITGFTELLLDTSLDDEQAEYVKTIQRSGESLLVLINDILDFSKIEAGQINFEIIDFDIEQLMSDVCELVKPKLDNKAVQILLDMDPETPTLLKGDPHRLRQVLINLMGNAAKFTADGEIKLSLKIEKKEDQRVFVHAEIQDTGIGIPNDKINAIFEIFSQADSSTTREFGGTGLGLSIAREISRKLGGDCWAESEPGRGSIFHVTGWLGISDETTIKIEALKETELTGKEILIIDDNTTNLDLLKKTFSGYRIKTTVLRSNKEAIKLLNDGILFDLVIVELGFTDPDTYQFFQQIRNQEHLKHIKFLAYTALAGDSYKRASELGFDGYLPKPAGRKKMIKMIETIFGHNPDHTTITQYTPVKEKAEHIPKKILLAEDNPVNQKLAVKILEKKGHLVMVAENGCRALKLLKEHSFDLILMDIQMPEMDGIEATSKIRLQETETGKHIPIIAMTANAMKGDREKYLEAGMDEYVSKPIKPKELFDKINALNRS